LSVSHLTRLLDMGEYRRCLQEASMLLAEGAHDAEGEARIQAAICRSYLELTDYQAAIAAGARAADLARRSGAHDVLGAVLLDLGTAQGQVRRSEDALSSFEEFLALLPAYTGARCLEGAARSRQAEVLQCMGRSGEALEAYRMAVHWFDRYGDEPGAQQCLHAMSRIYLDLRQPGKALRCLRESDHRARVRTESRASRCERLLSWARYRLAAGLNAEAARAGYAALECTEDRLDLQAEAQLIMCRAALSQDLPAEALSLALAARVAAIDGRHYEQEFEASQIIFRLLQERGMALLHEVEAVYRKQGVNIYHYLSERALREDYHGQ